MKHKTTIVIPVYNEGENICSTLTAIHRDVQGDYVIAVVYDQESDTTLPALDRWESETGCQVCRLRNKYGRGALNAIKTGLEQADSEYVIVTMADLSDPPAVMNDMIEKADSEQADIVCASRYMRGGKQVGGPFLKGLLSRCAGLSLHALAGLPTHDPTNSFKLYRKSFLNEMTIESSGGFELGLELVVKAWQGGYRVTEVPTSWADRVQGKSNFKLWKWLPSYLHWYFAALRGKKVRQNHEGLVKFGCLVLFLLFLFMHIPDPCPLFASIEEGGLDASWVRILTYAHHHDLQFGRDVIFTYGPLGYLLYPLDPTALFMSTLLSFALLLPFGVVFIRKKSITELAFLLIFTFVSVCYFSAYDVLVFLFPMLIWHILADEDPRIRYGGILYTSILGALCVFIKFMCFPVIVFSLLLADILLLKKRKIVFALPVFLLSLPLFWCFVAGQEISNLFSFFVYSWHIATGYGYAMTCSMEPPEWIIAVTAGAGAIFLMVLFSSRKACRSVIDGICYVMLPAPVLFVIYKYGVGRMDPQHIILSLCYLCLVAAFCAVNPRMSMKWRCLLLVIGMMLASLFLIAFSDPHAYLYLYPTMYSKFILEVFFAALLMYALMKYSIGTFAGRLFLIVLSAFLIYRAIDDLYYPRLERIEKYFDSQKKTAPPTSFSPTADCFSHDIRPLLNSKMRYSPRLVFQSYSSYTPLLLRKNAEHFEHGLAPEYIFYGTQELDEILPSAFDSPTLLQLINNYDPIPGYPMLRKKAICPPTMRLTEVGTVKSKFNRPIDLPQNVPYTWVAIEFYESFAGRLLKNLLRPPTVTVQLVLETGQIITHKIIPENCIVPFLLSPYLPSWTHLGYLLNPKDDKLPKVVSFSVHSVYNAVENERLSRKIGKHCFGRRFVVHFYRMELPPEKRAAK